MDGKNSRRVRIASVVLIAAALASAFGLSIYVTFAFFLLMLAWAAWQITIERTLRPALTLAAGGACATVLLLPYLWELTHTVSKLGGGSLFSFSVRETVPPTSLLASGFFRHLEAGHPLAALNLAKLILLTPGYAVEMGFYFLVFLIYMIPAWRGRTPLTSARRSLVFISATSIPLISLVRSGVLETNDFGWRAALLLQFPLLLLASDLITSWRCANCKLNAPANCAGLTYKTPGWLRSLATLTILFGIISTVYQALMMRFTLPLVDAAHARLVHDPVAGNLAHNAYISYLGYAQLDATISRDATVQANPDNANQFWQLVDWTGINHQTVIASDKQGCGSEFGGDPSGCSAMAAAVDSLFKNGTAEQARITCHQFGIEYLVAKIYDAAWNDKNGWVWKLSPAVADEEFRALDCRQ
jgi:hypothetical protein